jgi:hypothetical protein
MRLSAGGDKPRPYEIKIPVLAVSVMGASASS